MFVGSIHSSLAEGPVNLRRKIYEFILEKNEKRQQPPSQDEIREVFGNLTEDIDLHLLTLVREGLVVPDKDGGKGLSLVPTYIPAPQIQMLGRRPSRFGNCQPYSGGSSIALDLRGIGIPPKPGMFAVHVLDDGMSDAGIASGDIALLINTVPLRGDIVAVEEGEDLVLRRYLVVAGIPHFAAENPRFPDLRSGWESPMHGVFSGLVRLVSNGQKPRDNTARKPLGVSKTWMAGPAENQPKNVVKFTL